MAIQREERLTVSSRRREDDGMREYLVGKLADLADGKAIAVEAGRRTVAV